jgi:hypothetical protein
VVERIKSKEGKLNRLCLGVFFYLHVTGNTHHWYRTDKEKKSSPIQPTIIFSSRQSVGSCPTSHGGV